MTFGTTSNIEPVWWFVAYVVMMVFHVKGGKVFWHFMSVCTVVILIFLAIYLFGSIPNLNFEKYAYSNKKIVGFQASFDEFMLILRLPAWFFIGVDLMSLACEEVRDVSTIENVSSSMR